MRRPLNAPRAPLGCTPGGCPEQSPDAWRCARPSMCSGHPPVVPPGGALGDLLMRLYPQSGVALARAKVESERTGDLIAVVLSSASIQRHVSRTGVKSQRFSSEGLGVVIVSSGGSGGSEHERKLVPVVAAGARAISRADARSDTLGTCRRRPFSQPSTFSFATRVQRVAQLR